MLTWIKDDIEASVPGKARAEQWAAIGRDQSQVRQDSCYCC